MNVYLRNAGSEECQTLELVIPKFSSVLGSEVRYARVGLSHLASILQSFIDSLVVGDKGIGRIWC